MTLAQFVAKNAFRNRRRSVLTILSITFSLLLLTVMMSIWRGFYIDQGAPDSALRIMTRHRVSLAFFLPAYYRNKIRVLPGVTHVVPMTWFGGKYKDDRPENFFAQVETGSITGTVRDSSGAAISGATVKARNLATSAERSANSGDNGQYNIPGLPPGNYEVTVTSTGFANWTGRTEVTVGGIVTVDPQLSVSNQTTTIEVVAAGDQP